MRQLITRIDEELHDKLKRKAAAEGRSMNRVVTEAIERVVAEEESSRETFRRLAEAAGVRFVDVEPPTGPVPTWDVLDAETRGLGPVFSRALDTERAE